MSLPTYHGFAGCMNARDDMGRLREGDGRAPAALYLTNYHVELATRLLGRADPHKDPPRFKVSPGRWAWDTNMFRTMVDRADDPAGLTKLVKNWLRRLPPGWL